VALSAGQFKTSLSYRSSNSLTLSYTNGSSCGSSSSYSTTIVFLCHPGMLYDTKSTCMLWYLGFSYILQYLWPSLPYLTFRVGRLLHLPSAEAVSVRPNAQPRCNPKVTVIGCEAKTSAVRPKSAVKPNKSPATWDW